LVFHSSTIAMMHGPINIRDNMFHTRYVPLCMHRTASCSHGSWDVGVSVSR